MGLCLRRLVLPYPWRGGRVQPESAAAFNRNQWQPSAGIGGRVRPESVATFARNTQMWKMRVVDVGCRAVPGTNQPPLIQDETQFAPHNPPMIALPFFAHLRRAAPFPHRVDQLDPIA